MTLREKTLPVNSTHGIHLMIHIPGIYQWIHFKQNVYYYQIMHSKQNAT